MFITGLLIGAIPVSSSPSDSWTLVAQRGVKAYPNLNETVWQKNASAPPHGPYDKIGLHRLVKTGITPQGVLFILPGTWSGGEQLISNPLNASWTAYENNSIALYLANRNFDIYSIDYRTHFVPISLNASQLSFMANWGWDQWISDIKEAVNKIKEVSGAQKIYMAGESFGGIAAMNYASLYWKDDLNGLIMLDAAAMGLTDGLGARNPSPTNTYNLTAARIRMNATGNWASEADTGSLFIFKEADQHPGDPSPYPGYANITEWCKFAIYFGWGLGGISNIYGGYGKASVMIHICATFDRWWPNRLSNDTTAYSDWTNCQYLTNDFDDLYSGINVPLLAFQSEHFGYLVFGAFKDGIASPDFTRILLTGYGHLDVFAGNYITTDVNEPTYQWLTGWRLLTVTSSPMTGITFTINGTLETTPYTQWLKGSYTLQMPKNYMARVWSRWLEDNSTTRTKTVNMNTSVTLTGVFVEPVGGIWIPVDKSALLAPYIALASTIILAIAITAAFFKYKKKQ
jgi:pimeloyl-ACP methyl ester carboxylesterase